MILQNLASESFFRAFKILLLWRRGGHDEVFETVALCGNPARGDALAVAPRALRACAWAPCAFLTRSRGRLRGSGVLDVCRGRAGGRAAALCRGDWVPGVFCTRMANVRFAWQAAGIVRAGSVLGGSVLAGRVGGAVPWGLGSGRVARAHDFTRCDLRFAWQVWDSGCMSALGKALEGGSAWQAQ